MKPLIKLIFFALLSFFCTNNTYGFSDIQFFEWKHSVEFLQEKGIVKGYPDNSFRPENEINRAELIKIIIGTIFSEEEIKSSDTDCFPDVPKNIWYAPYVCTAKEQGIINGYSDGTFRPSNLITQAELMKIVIGIFFYDDAMDDIGGPWYEKYFVRASEIGMNYFDTENYAAHRINRGEMSYFIAWILDEDKVDQIE